MTQLFRELGAAAILAASMKVLTLRVFRMAATLGLRRTPLVLNFGWSRTSFLFTIAGQGIHWSQYCVNDQCCYPGLQR